MDTDMNKTLRGTMALTLIEGICFFMAGVCGLMAGSILGYISGGVLIVLGCLNLVAVFLGGGKYFLNLGLSLAENETAEEYGARVEEDDKE